MIETVPFVRVCCDGSDEEWPDGVNGGVKAAFYRKGKEDSVERVGKLKNRRMEASESDKG